MSDHLERAEEARERVAGLEYEERWNEDRYRPLDGHDAGEEDETCDEDGCNGAPSHVRLATGQWVCSDHAR